LAELEKYLASVDLLAEFKHSMRGERALNVSGLDYLRRQGFKANASGYGFMGDDGSAQKMEHSLNLVPSGMLYQNMLTIARMHQDFTLAAVDEQSHRVFPVISKAADDAVETLHKGFYPYSVFASMLFPAFSKTSMKSGRMQTYVDAARVACGLERYRMANGRLPDTLDTLAPRFVEKIPNDVIDGKPLRYRTTADGGYVMYSVGWNKTDDGGELVWTKGKNPSIDATKGDWVWRSPPRK
jgi:hypothetical protein